MRKLKQLTFVQQGERESLWGKKYHPHPQTCFSQILVKALAKMQV